MPKSKLYCAEQDAILVCAIDVLSVERDTQYKARLLCCVLILFRLYFNFSLKQSRSCDWVCYFIVCQVNWNRNRVLRDSFSVYCWHSSRLDCNLSVTNTQNYRKSFWNWRWKMFLFLSVLLATIVAYLLRFHYDIFHALYLSFKINGPPALPIIGNGLLFLNNSSAGSLSTENKIKTEFYQSVDDFVHLFNSKSIYYIYCPQKILILSLI